MTLDPYSPPTAPLATLAQLKRPKSVVISTVLLGVSYVIGISNALSTSGPPLTIPSMTGLIIGLLIFSGLLLAVYCRKNWARWITVTLVAIAMILLPGFISRTPGTIDKVVYISQAAMQLLAVVLFLLPAANHWYRPNNSFKPKPLRGSA